MGIGVEQVYFSVPDTKSAHNTLRDILVFSGREYTENAFTIREPIPDYNFERHKMRYFVLAEYSRGLCCLTEAGDVADWNLAVKLATTLKESVRVVALFEAVNAWGHIDISAEGDINKKLFPEAAWHNNPLESELDWPGDATEQAWKYAEKSSLPNPFLSYTQHRLGNFATNPLRIWWMGFKRK